jgi:hypothetical protein
MKGRSQNIAQIAFGTISGGLFAGLLSAVWWYVINYIYPGGSFSRGGGALVMGIFGALIGCVGGLLSGLIILLAKCKYYYGALIGVLSSGFVLVTPPILLDGVSEVSEIGFVVLLLSFGHLACGGLTGLLLTIFVEKMNRSMEEKP